MAYRIGRVPLASEVNALDTEVSGHQRVVAGGGAEYGTIIADPVYNSSCGGLRRRCSLANAASNSSYEFLLSYGQSATTIKEESAKRSGTPAENRCTVLCWIKMTIRTYTTR